MIVMRRTDHRTLLQSFRFWFVLLSVFALAAAWKLDLFGNRRAVRDHKRVTSETLPAPEADIEPTAMLSDVSEGVDSPAPEPIDLHGVSPAPLPPRETPRQRKTAPVAQKPASAPQQSEPKNPFGPANPEFVAMTPERESMWKDQRQPAVAASAPLAQPSSDAGAPARFERGERRMASL